MRLIAAVLQPSFPVPYFQNSRYNYVMIYRNKDEQSVASKQTEKSQSHGTMTDNNHAALWHGRFKEGPDAAAVEFETSIYVDERMALDDIHGSKAHAAMLAKQKIISEDENKAIQAGLDSIENDLESGKLTIDYSAEDIHSFIEATLTDRTGDAGKKASHWKKPQRPDCA